MSTFTSQAIRKRDASPPVRMNPEESRGKGKVAVGVEKIPAAGAGTAIKLIAIPSNARLHALEYARENLGTSTLDVAVWYETTLPQGGKASVAASSGGTLISSSAFVGGLSGTDAGLGWTDAMGLATTPALGNRDNPLWQMLGLSQDPEGLIDIGISVRVANSTAGYVGLRASYVD